MTLDPREQARLDQIERSLHLNDATLNAWATGRGGPPPRPGTWFGSRRWRRAALAVACMLLPGVLLFAAALGSSVLGVVVAGLVIAPPITFVLGNLRRAPQAEPPGGARPPKRPG